MGVELRHGPTGIALAARGGPLFSGQLGWGDNRDGEPAPGVPDYVLHVGLVRPTGSGLRICDVARGDDVFTAIEGPDAADPAATVVLREVHNLSESQQAVLADLIADRDDPRSLTRRRLISTSAVSLVHRVKHGLFDARLFYLLNPIHIVVRPARDYEPADREGVLWLPSSNELSRDRFRRTRTLSGAPPLLASIIDILSATSKKR